MANRGSRGHFDGIFDGAAVHSGQGFGLQHHSLARSRRPVGAGHQLSRIVKHRDSHSRLRGGRGQGRAIIHRIDQPELNARHGLGLDDRLQLLPVRIQTLSIGED